jgi:hypothetical protein
MRPNRNARNGMKWLGGRIMNVSYLGIDNPEAAPTINAMEIRDQSSDCFCEAREQNQP